MKSAEEIVQALRKDKSIAEAQVLIREIRMVLDVEHDTYRPSFSVRIYLPSLTYTQPYLFDVSHFVHTPVQAQPATSSRVLASSETEAIHLAVSLVTQWLREAIRAGHEPDDTWMIPNANF